MESFQKKLLSFAVVAFVSSAVSVKAPWLAGALFW